MTTAGIIVPTLSALRSSEATADQCLRSLESVFFKAPVGLCAVDLEFRYIVVNECFADLYRKPVAHFLGRTVREALPGPASQIIAHLKRALVAGAIVECEITFADPRNQDLPSTDGEEGTPGRYEDLVYLRSAQPVRDGCGRVVGLSVALLDISARKRAEAALRDSEENLRYTVELTPHIPWTADEKGDLIFMSPRWHELTGTVPSPSLLKRWILGVHADDRAQTLVHWRHSIATGEAFDADYRLRCCNGDWRWHRARAYPRRDPAGAVLRWYGTIEDIHDRKRAEAALTSKTERLEELTRELNRRAYEDYLTGLANRRTSDTTLLREIERARRAQLPLSFVLLDIDHFKRYNDEFGHAAGDLVLRSVALALNGVIRRPGDLAARFGGEEFSLILPNTTAEGAVIIAAKACEAVRALPLTQRDRRVVAITISAGVAALETTPAITGPATLDVARELIEQADQALYRAKSEGRDRVVRFESERVTV